MHPLGTDVIRRHVRLGLLLLPLLFFPQPLRASFMDGLGVGARPMAMGSAYTAVSDDLMAVYYNPAGLAQMQDHQIQFGYIWSNPTLRASSATDPSFGAESVMSNSLNCPFIAMGFNLDRMMKGKVPVEARIALINALPDDFKSVYRAWYVESDVPRWIRFGDYWDRVHLLGALSLRLADVPWISIGLGFRFIINGKNYLVERDGVPGLHLIVEGLGDVDVNGNIDLDVDTRITPTAGILLTPLENLRLAYSFRNSLTLDLDPVVSQGVIQLGPNPLLSVDLVLSLKFDAYYMPQEHNWGVSYLLADRLLVALDLSWFRWSEYRSIVNGKPEPPAKDTLIPRVGVEYLVTDDLALRLGYFFEPSPIREQVQRSNLLDSDRHVFSFGAGYTFDAPLNILKHPVTLNLMLQYMHLPTRTTVKQAGYTPAQFETSGEAITVAGDIAFRF